MCSIELLRSHFVRMCMDICRIVGTTSSKLKHCKSGGHLNGVTEWTIPVISSFVAHASTRAASTVVSTSALGQIPQKLAAFIELAGSSGAPDRPSAATVASNTSITGIWQSINTAA
jgi:hypothetical protein